MRIVNKSKSLLCQEGRNEGFGDRAVSEEGERENYTFTGCPIIFVRSAI